MAKKRKVGNLLALAVLTYLMQRPMHPYELGQMLRNNGDARSIKFNHGSLYMVVQQLTKAGFIAEQETSRDGQRPERTVYRLTDAGREEMRDWLRDLVAQPTHEYPQFVAALSQIAALPPDEVVTLLNVRLHRLAELRAETRTMIDKVLSDEVHPLFLIEDEYRISQIDAEVSFVERFIERITHPETGWRQLWSQFHVDSTDAPQTTEP